MKIVGLITEYNPFHNGHLYHMQKAKEITGADSVIAVMSGNYVQRGAPAIMPKHLRAEWLWKPESLWFWSCPSATHPEVRSTLPTAPSPYLKSSGALTPSVLVVNVEITICLKKSHM